LAKQTTLKVYSSLDNKIKRLEDLVEEEVKDRLEYIANYATIVSPVDTGAYINSFSFLVGAGRPRGKSSNSRPEANREAAINEARGNLYADISKLDLSQMDSVTLRNGAPHAEAVEKKYSVFTKVRNKFG
jgi:flagellar motility protein MotE (MotC chaperone)